jgi:ABC-type Fe3+/spermidine/putrescine transport system ATPase subunit
MKIRKKLRRDLRKIQREFGTTMIFVTHDQEEAFELGDIISIMHGGRIEQCGDPMELYDGPSSLFVSSFLGEANMIDIKKDKGAMVMIRPENVQISKKGSCWYESGTEGVITELIQLGPILEYKVLLKNGDTLRSVATRSDLCTKGLKVGDSVMVNILRFRYLGKGT